LHLDKEKQEPVSKSFFQINDETHSSNNKTNEKLNRSYHSKKLMNFGSTENISDSYLDQSIKREFNKPSRKNKRSSFMKDVKAILDRTEKKNEIKKKERK